MRGGDVWVIYYVEKNDLMNLKVQGRRDLNAMARQQRL